MERGDKAEVDKEEGDETGNGAKERPMTPHSTIHGWFLLPAGGIGKLIITHMPAQRQWQRQKYPGHVILKKCQDTF
jgi:hypothetical protein